MATLSLPDSKTTLSLPVLKKKEKEKEKEEEEKILSLPDIEIKEKEEVITTEKEPSALDKAFPGWTNAEIIQGYRDKAVLSLPETKKSLLESIADKSLSVESIKELWSTPLGLSEKSIEESRKIFGDPEESILGKFNSILVEGGIKTGDLLIRTATTPLFAVTGLAGDTLGTITELMDKGTFRGKTASRKLFRDLNGLVMSILGTTGATWRPLPVKLSKSKDLVALENIKTGEKVSDIINYSRRSGRTKEQVITEVRNALEKEIATIKQKENIIVDQSIAKLLDRSDISKTEILSRDNIIQKQSQKALDIIHNKGGYKYEPLGLLPRKDSYLQMRYGTLGKMFDLNKLTDKVFNDFYKAPKKIKDEMYEYFVTRGGVAKNMISDATFALKAEKVKSQINAMGKELAKRGLLPKEIVDKNYDSYLPRIYIKHLDKNMALGYTKKRTLKDPDIRAILGEITDPALAASAGLNHPVRDMIWYDFFEEIARDSEWALPKQVLEYKGKKVTPYFLDAEATALKDRLPYLEKNQKPIAEKTIKEMEALATEAKKDLQQYVTADSNKPINFKDYKQIPDQARYGSMRGLYVRKEIYNDLIPAFELVNNPNLIQKMFGMEGYLTKANRFWKLSKVAMNPPTQFRNLVSNMVLLNLSGVSFPMVPVRMVQAMRDIAKGGIYTRIAEKHGVYQTTFQKNEMVNINKNLLKFRADTGKGWNTWINYLSVVPRKASDMYQFIEVVGKTAKIIDMMKKGATEGEAALAAHKALFDYSLVPPLVKGLRSYPIGVPFVTFYYKALPRIIEAISKRPHKLLPYLAIPTAISLWIARDYDISLEDLKKFRMAFPEFIREKGNVWILPFKDQYGRWQAFDFSYYLPWAMYVESINHLRKGEVKEAGKSFGLLSGLLPSILAAYQTGIDPFTKRKITDENKPAASQLADWLTWTWRTIAPTFLTDIGFAGKLYKTIDKEATDIGIEEADKTLTKAQAILRFFGANVYPIDPEASRIQNIKNMRYEITKIKSNMIKAIKDHVGTDEEKENERKGYLKLIEERRKQLMEYMEKSELPEQMQKGYKKKKKLSLPD